jgi:DNA-binding response OmpR family regulator
MSNKRILVADDEPHLIRSLSFILTKEGYEVITASNGEEAIQKAIENKPVLMFLDVMMPKKNGYEVCQRIRSIPDFKEMLIIILSAKGGDVDREKALSVGANEFMTKPFSPLEVVSKVKIFMEKLSQILIQERAV